MTRPATGPRSAASAWMVLNSSARSDRLDDSLLTGRAAIAIAIERLFRALEGDDDTAAHALEVLVDRLLEEAPAPSLMLLERRLLGLAAALEHLGSTAPEDVLIRQALANGDRLH